jgi:hypothetical protein
VQIQVRENETIECPICAEAVEVSILCLDFGAPVCLIKSFKLHCVLACSFHLHTICYVRCDHANTSGASLSLLRTRQKHAETIMALLMNVLDALRLKTN